MNASEPKIYYHFTGANLRDGSPIPPLGEWLELPANIKIKMCPSNDDLARGYGGLHASERPFDALQYAPGPLLHRVELDGIAERDSEKVVARRRKIIASIDATTLLRKFARKQALSVMHLLDAPEVVKRYLETGEESLGNYIDNSLNGENEWVIHTLAPNAVNTMILWWTFQNTSSRKLSVCVVRRDLLTKCW